MKFADQFWTWIDTSGGDEACWPWLGGCSRDGHGMVNWQGRTQLAHRVAYELTTGRPLRPGVVLMHKCDFPACCNPAHHLEGTHQANRADCVAKGRQARGERNGRAKLHDQDVIRLREWWERGLITQGEAARLFGITKRAVRFIVKRQHYAHL